MTARRAVLCRIAAETAQTLTGATAVHSGGFDGRRGIPAVGGGVERCAACGFRFFGFGVRGGFLRLCGFDRGFIVRRRLPHREGNGARRAGGQAIAEPVAVVVAQKACFTLHHADRALVARTRAGAATVTFFFIYMNDFTNHRDSSVS